MDTTRVLSWQETITKSAKIFNVNEGDLDMVFARHMPLEKDETFSLDDARDCDRFARTMRHTQRISKLNIGVNSLTQALLRFHLECEGVDISTFPIAATSAKTAQEYLDLLQKHGSINTPQSRHARFYFITEKCIVAVRDVLRVHNHNLFKALLDGLRSNVIDRQKANVAMFCLLTDLSPTEARERDMAPHIEYDAVDDERKTFKAKELPVAVKAALADRTDLFPMDRVSICIQAQLFPFASSREEIRDCLEEHMGDDADPEYAEGEAQYKRRFFKKLTNCANEEQITSHLAQHDTMEKAVVEYRKKVLAAPPYAHVRPHDTLDFPFVNPETIIIGLLGTVDEDDEHTHNARPDEDGWFISDALYNKKCLEGMGSEQTWLKCLYFDRLVKKYCSGDKYEGEDRDRRQISWSTGYVHGQATDERRIVLDAETLKDESFLKNWLLYPAASLRKQYLALVEAKFAQAQASGQPVLLLMFAHGDIDSSLGGLLIGFINPANKEKKDFLTAADIEAIHCKYPDVRLALFLTSCYSGHWVSTEYFTAKGITVLAGARPDEESHAWRESESFRHGGGVWSSAFLEELKNEPDNPMQSDDSRHYEQLMIDLAARCARLCNPNDVDKALWSLPMFSVTDTKEKFPTRTGYALHRYKANCDQLRKIPRSEEGRKEPEDEVPGTSTGAISWRAGMQTGGAVSMGNRMSSHGQTSAKLRQNVTYLIFEYKKANSQLQYKLPNDHEIASMIGSFETGSEQNEQQLSALQAQLTFRMGKLDFAKSLVKQMGLYLGAAVDIHTWDGLLPAEPEYRDRVSAIATQLRQNTDWFKPKRNSDGLPYGKPWKYVAHALYLHGHEGDEVLEVIERGKAIVDATVRLGSKRLRGTRSWKDMMNEHRKKTKLEDFAEFAAGQENPASQGSKAAEVEDPYANETEEETQARLDMSF